MPSVNSLCICKCVGRCVTDNSSGLFICNLWHLKADFWKLVVNHTGKSITRSLCKRPEVTDALNWMMKLHISLFFFFRQHKTGKEDCKPDWSSWETLSTWHTSTQDVGSCQSTTIFSMTISPFCTESAHVWISWRAQCSSLLCSFHLLCLLSFLVRLMLSFVCKPTRWGSHPGRWQRNSRQKPFLNMALAGVQRPTYVETSRRR